MEACHVKEDNIACIQHRQYIQIESQNQTKSRADRDRKAEALCGTAETGQRTNTIEDKADSRTGSETGGGAGTCEQACPGRCDEARGSADA